MKDFMRVFLVALVVAVGIAFVVGCGSKQESAAGTPAPSDEGALVQTTCPVMGGKIDKDLYVDVEGKRIYACCAGCLDKIREEPDKYIKKLEDQGVVLEKAPGAASAQ